MPPSGLDPAAGLAVVDEGEVAVDDDGGDKEVGDATSLSLSFGRPEGEEGAGVLGKVPYLAVCRHVNVHGVRRQPR